MMNEHAAESCSLQPMQADHLDRICRIEGASFSNPWPRESFLGDLRSPHARCIVALIDELVVGYAIGWFVLDELHVLNLAVEPEHRRRGIGKRLLQDLLDAAQRRGCRYAALELRSSNQPAGRLYQEYGFRPVAVRKKYYRHPTEDAVIMWLDLDLGTPPGSSGLEVIDGVVSEG
jgi:ribosomal-protein-alanine N-acetyltransferase